MLPFLAKTQESLAAGPVVILLAFLLLQINTNVLLVNLKPFMFPPKFLSLLDSHL